MNQILLRGALALLIAGILVFVANEIATGGYELTRVLSLSFIIIGLILFVLGFWR